MANSTFWSDKNNSGSYHHYNIPDGDSELKVDLDSGDDNSLWQPDNKHKMNNDTESIQLAEGYYLLAYSDTNYTENSSYFAKMDASKSDLNDQPAFRGNHDMNKHIGSFKLMNYEPVYWNPNKSDRKSSDGTWVKFFSDYNYNELVDAPDSTNNVNNDSATRVVNFLYGASDIDYKDYLNLFKYLIPGTTSDWEHYFQVKSMVTGPNTWIILSRGNTTFNIGPNTYIPDTDTLFSSTEADESSFSSVSIMDSEPSDWVPSIDPAADPYIVLEYKNFNTASKLIQCTLDLVGLVPIPGSDVVAGICGLFMDAFWPSGDPSSTEIWDNVKAYGNVLVKDFQDATAISNMDSDLDSFGTYLKQILNFEPGSGRQNEMDGLQSLLINDTDDFLGDTTLSDAKTQLTYQIAFSTLYIMVYWLYAHHFESITGTEADPNDQQGFIKNLDDVINSCVSSINDSVNNSLAWRIGSDNLVTEQIYVESNSYQVKDMFTGLVYDNLTEDEAADKVTDLQDYLTTNYGLELNLYAYPSNYFNLLLSTNTDTPAYIPMEYPIPMGSNVSNLGTTKKLNGAYITSIDIYGGGTNSREYVAGIKFEFSDGSSFSKGSTSSSYVVSQSLNEDENIIVVYGRFDGDKLNQLHIQTDQGIDLGLGSGDGDPFLLKTPGGLGYTTCIDSIEAGENASGELQYMIFNFSILQPPTDIYNVLTPPSND